MRTEQCAFYQKCLDHASDENTDFDCTECNGSFENAQFKQLRIRTKATANNKEKNMDKKRLLGDSNAKIYVSFYARADLYDFVRKEAKKNLRQFDHQILFFIQKAYDEANK